MSPSKRYAASAARGRCPYPHCGCTSCLLPATRQHELPATCTHAAAGFSPAEVASASLDATWFQYDLSSSAQHGTARHSTAQHGTAQLSTSVGTFPWLVLHRHRAAAAARGNAHTHCPTRQQQPRRQVALSGRRAAAVGTDRFKFAPRFWEAMQRQEKALPAMPRTKAGLARTSWACSRRQAQQGSSQPSGQAEGATHHNRCLPAAQPALLPLANELGIRGVPLA